MTSVVVVDLATYGSAERSAVTGEDGRRAVDDPGLTWRDTSHHVGLIDDGVLVAHAGWVTVGARIGDQPAEVVGLGGVAVRQDHRGRGLGALVVRAAMHRMRDVGPAHGLLFCGPGLVPFYGALGWIPLTGDVHVLQPTGPVVMPMPTCWLALDPATAPPRELRLDGLPF